MSLPPMLAANPRLDRWVGFEPDGRARIAFGRMEYGQGVGTSLAQMAAAFGQDLLRGGSDDLCRFR